MSSLGSFLLLAAFVVCSYAAVISVVGARRQSRALIESGIGAFYLVCALMTVASAVIVNAFLTDDFSIKYVAHYSEAAQPLFYKITSYWGGLDGSIMFWVFLLSIFGTCAVYTNRERHRELIPYVVATISVVEMFFLFLMVVHKNPFTTFLTPAAADGKGLNPLLQNYWMAIHPPSLYTGFVGMTIPFAFGIAALITGHLDDSWLRAVRRWTMVSWLFLSFGLTLGMIWAYEVLGWGGYWGWDPVENAGLLPWFTATAFLHSVMVQERRSMLRVWNVVLVIMTFFLTIFGTFMTRSGVVQSVHAFGEDPILARLFIGFMVVIATFSFGLVIYRLPLLRARNELDSWISREAAFLVNNWILLFSAMFILFATMFPTLSEAVTGNRIAVAQPFFNKWMLPIGFILLFLTGVGPLLAWRKSAITNLRDSFLLPIASGVVTAGVLAALGFRVWVSGLCFALCAFVAGTILQEFWRGANVRRRATGTDVFTALVGLVGRNKRRYGGYIVHVGIALMFVGFTGRAWSVDKEASLMPGQSTTIEEYTITYAGPRMEVDSEKRMIFADVDVLRNGSPAGRISPAKFIYKTMPEAPATIVGRHITAKNDLYMIIGMVNPQTKVAAFQIHVNMLISFIWLGGIVLALGAMVAMWPDVAMEEAGAFSYVRAAASVTTAVAFGFLMAGASAQAYGAPSFSGRDGAPPAAAAPLSESAATPLSGAAVAQ
jgi:cytochrome c-type biogenesis protein CcmF